jgi:hypothetical protein
MSSMRMFSVTPSQSGSDSSHKPAGVIPSTPVAVSGNTNFTAPPSEMPPCIPLSQVDLSTYEPRLAKHSKYGWLVYQSPMEKAVRAVKAFSLTSAAMAILSAPVMLVLANPDMAMVGRAAIVTTVVSFGISTTIALTYFTRSYITRIFARQAQPISTVSADSTLTADDAAARNWILTVETLNVFGRPVYAVAPHSSFHPLFSTLFNNVRMETLPHEADESHGILPVKKDLFVHMDMATNPILIPLWAKPIVVSTRPLVKVGESAEPTITERVTLSLKQATEKLEEINKQHAAKLAAEAAAKAEAEKSNNAQETEKK